MLPIDYHMTKSSSKYTESFIQFFSANLITKFIGFFKEIFLGWIFGATKILDHFFFLTSIANVFNATWNKALETTVFQEYQKKRIEDSTEKADEYLLNTILSFTLITILFVILLNLILPAIFSFILNQNISDSFILAGRLITATVIVETFVLSLKIYKFAEKKFFLTSMLPSFQSFTLLAGLLLFKDIKTISFLALLYLAGTSFQLVLLSSLKKTLRQFRFFSFRYFSDSFKLVKKSILLTLASGISTLNIFVDQSFAMNLPDGAVSYIHYGAFFLTFYQVLFVRNINTIFFPQFQEYAIHKEWDKLKSDTIKILKIIFLSSILIWLIILNNGEFFLKLILGYGNMSGEAIQIIYFCMLGYSLAFLGTALNAILIRILHVYDAFKFIFYISLMNFHLNLVFNFLFVRWFGIWGIPLSTSVTFLMIVITYFIYLFKYHHLILIEFRDLWYKKFLFAFILSFIIGGGFYVMNLQLELNYYLFNVISFLVTIILFSWIVFKLKLIKIEKKKLVIL